jgi:hypothetical protein
MNNIYEFKSRLKLESWENNENLSGTMKDFYKKIIDCIHNLEIQQNINKILVDEKVQTMEKYLKHKFIEDEYNRFEIFTKSNPTLSETEIKSFFRKEKINQILNMENI